MAGLNLVPDERLIIQAAIFVAALGCAHYYFIKPGLRLHAERKRRTSGAVASVEKEESRILKLETEYDSKLKVATSQAKELRNKEIQSGQAEAEDILRQAQEAAKIQVEEVRVKVGAQFESEKTKISSIASEVAKSILQKVTLLLLAGLALMAGTSSILRLLPVAAVLLIFGQAYFGLTFSLHSTLLECGSLDASLPTKFFKQSVTT